MKLVHIVFVIFCSVLLAGCAKSVGPANESCQEALTMQNPDMYEVVEKYNLCLDTELSDEERSYMLYHRGLVYIGLSGYDPAMTNMAINDYTDAIEYDPTNAELHQMLGNALEDTGKLQDAVEKYSSAIELDPDNEDYLGDRGLVYVKLGEKELGLKDYTRGLELNPDSVQLLVDRAKLYVIMGKYDSALADGAKAVEIDPLKGSGYSVQGKGHMGLNQHNEAVAVLTDGIERVPDFSRNYYLRAVSYYVLGDLDKAQADLDIYNEMEKGEPIMVEELALEMDQF